MILCMHDSHFIHTDDTPKLQDVFKELFGLASHWKTIGTLLGLKGDLLNKIKSDEAETHDRLQKMLSEWLKQVDPLYPLGRT